jgi:hypothetical protein
VFALEAFTFFEDGVGLFQCAPLPAIFAGEFEQDVGVHPVLLIQ